MGSHFGCKNSSIWLRIFCTETKEKISRATSERIGSRPKKRKDEAGGFRSFVFDLCFRFILGFLVYLWSKYCSKSTKSCNCCSYYFVSGFPQLLRVYLVFNYLIDVCRRSISDDQSFIFKILSISIKKLSLCFL